MSIVCVGLSYVWHYLMVLSLSCVINRHSIIPSLMAPCYDTVLPSLHAENIERSDLPTTYTTTHAETTHATLF